ncbi:MAG TPA: hypothetical protein VG603_13905, partial [Chitinophagales bacterium]|nr:hypothetical protein [Chitinophagales bacterium]
MSRPKTDKTKISEQGVVTEQALLAYLRNELTPQERQEVEKLLHNDPFAQDALEGLQASLFQETIPDTLISLNRKIRERSGQREKKVIQLHWTNYAWASVVLGLLIGVGVVMINFLGKKETPIAQNQRNKEIIP